MLTCSQCGAAMTETEPDEADIWFVDKDEDIPTEGAKVFICAKCKTLEAEQ